MDIFTFDDFRVEDNPTKTHKVFANKVLSKLSNTQHKSAKHSRLINEMREFIVNGWQAPEEGLKRLSEVLDFMCKNNMDAEEHEDKEDNKDKNDENLSESEK